MDKLLRKLPMFAGERSLLETFNSLNAKAGYLLNYFHRQPCRQGIFGNFKGSFFPRIASKLIQPKSGR
jgi:hypothetical protein